MVGVKFFCDIISITLLITYYQRGMPKKTQSKKTTKKVDFLKLDVDEQVNQINEALSEEVYQALEMDGGGMEIMDITIIKDHMQVLISYYGACGGCHLATTGTLDFITQTLREKLDPRIEVVVV